MDPRDYFLPEPAEPPPLDEEADLDNINALLKEIADENK